MLITKHDTCNDVVSGSNRTMKIRLRTASTHLRNVFSRTTEINEGNINKVGAVTDSHCLLFKRVLRSHRNDLSQLQILNK